MIYANIVTGIFIKRPNRFIAHVIIDGREEKAHVKEHWQMQGIADSRRTCISSGT